MGFRVSQSTTASLGQRRRVLQWPVLNAPALSGRVYLWLDGPAA